MQLEHALGEQETTHDIASGGDHGQHAEHKRKGGLVLSHQDDGAHYSDGVQGNRAGQGYAGLSPWGPHAYGVSAGAGTR